MPSTYKTIIEYMVREVRSDLSAAVFNLENQDELDELEVVNIFQVN